MFSLIDRIPFFLRVILAASVIIALALMFNMWESLRGDYGWRWGYDVPERVGQWLPSVMAVIVYLVGAFWLMRREPRPAWQVIIWSLLGSALLPFIFLGRWDDPFREQYSRLASGTVSGPYLLALQYDDIEDVLKNWPEEQQRLADEEISIHAALAPPGLPMLYYGANQILNGASFVADPLSRELRPYQCHNLDLMAASNAEMSSSALGMASPFWAALTILPLFWLARRLLDESSARWAALTWALLPGIALFTPVPNTWFPALAILCVWLVWGALEDRRFSRIFVAGMVASLLTFLNFSVVPLLLFIGLLALGYHLLLARESERWYWSLLMGAVFGAGLIVVWLVWIIWGGPPPWDMLQTAMSQHLTLERQYFPWLFLHIWDYALFIGLPVMLLSLWTIWQAIRTGRDASRIGVFALAFGLGLLILDVSGTARGETGRVWQFLFPMSLLIALAALRELPQMNHRGLLAVQGSFALVLALFVPVIGTPFDAPPTSPPEVTAANIAIQTDTRFGEALHLTGFGAAFDDDNLILDLRWQTERQADQAYYFAVIPVAPDGAPYQDSLVYQPFDTDYPVTCWEPGQEVIDRVTIPLDGDPPPGEWWVSLSAHDYFDFEALPVTLPDGTTDTQAGIGPFMR